MDDKIQNIELPGAWWGTYVTRTGLGCGECDWEHALPTPFVMGDAARVAIGHWEWDARYDQLAKEWHKRFMDKG